MTLAEEKRSRKPQWAGVGNWLGVAAAFLLVAGLAWLVDSLPRAPSLSVAMSGISAHAAGDHRNCALHFALEEKPISLDEAARLYEPGYRGLREAVATASPIADGQVQLVEAHACVFRGRRFAHIVFRRGGRVVSLLVTPTRQDGIAGKLTDVSACPASGDRYRIRPVRCPRCSWSRTCRTPTTSRWRACSCLPCARIWPAREE